MNSLKKLLNRLTKTGKIILMVTALASVLFVVAGIISLEPSGKKQETPKTEEKKDEVVQLVLDKRVSTTTKSGSSYYFEFSSKTKGAYFITIENGDLKDLYLSDDKDESVSYTMYESSETTKTYLVTLKSNYDYTFKVRATSTKVRITVSQS